MPNPSKDTSNNQTFKDHRANVSTLFHFPVTKRGATPICHLMQSEVASYTNNPLGKKGVDMGLAPSLLRVGGRADGCS